jgi:predicted dehydrogenase
MTFKSVFIGCGPRANRHGEAYAHVRSFQLSAIADLDPARLAKIGDKFNVAARYSDFRQMLREVKPELVHCVTQPKFRVEPVQACADAGVKAIIIEKPMAETLDDALKIEQIAQKTGIKVIVNTQRRYFASWRALCELIHSGKAGDIRRIHLVSNPPVSCIGSHVLDMVQLLMHDADPLTVWGATYGAEDWHTTHPGPASMMASIMYPGRIPLTMEMSKDAVGIKGCPSFWGSFGFDILTSKGHVWWTESNNWGYQLHGMAQPTIHTTNFATDDAPGQGAFTEAIARWLENPAVAHGNRLETALRVYRIVCTIMQSAVENRRLNFDPQCRNDPFAALRAKLVAGEGDHPERVDWGTCVDRAPTPPAPAPVPAKA